MNTKLYNQAKSWLDANVWDGENRTGCFNDWTKHSPDELQELVEDLLEHLIEEKLICHTNGTET